MSSIFVQVVDEPFKCHDAVRIEQGGAHVGPERQTTLLRSCVCVGFYHAAKGVGALSHITGFGDTGAHAPAGAIAIIQTGLGRFGLELSDCECFLIGGSAAARHVYEAVAVELHKRNLRYKRIDTLGRFHRKLLFDPATGALLLFKKEVAGESAEERLLFRADPDGACFANPQRRIVTGASLLFRNKRLMGLLRDIALPEVLARGPRIHVWCAGCSIGMEAYSIAMLILDWLTRQTRRTEVLVLGSDISEEALETAQRGEYPIGGAVVREYKPLLDRYAAWLDRSTVRMGPELRSVVRFKLRDIREGSRSHRFEIVVCDHVMQYFSVEHQCLFAASLVRAMQPDGFLFVSSPAQGIEEYLVGSQGLEKIERHFYRRKTSAPHAERG
jgi:chemotaxis methyl-accepting protein methylase/chemotaxis receptor (MCP) glutamine deamidase CheD